jgi:hypothetical protein
MSRSCKQIVIAAALLTFFSPVAHAIMVPAHDWTLRIGGHSFGLVGYDTARGPVTFVSYGFGDAPIPMHIYAVVGVGSAIPLLIASVYVFRRRAKRSAS